MRRLYAFLIPLALILAADQLTKWWARGALWDPRREIDLLPGLIYLTPVENRGVAFGLFSRYGALLAVFVLVLLVVVVARSWQEFLAAKNAFKIPAGMIIGGGIGNLIDRLQLGYVVDFITLPPLPIFQVFNIADAAISLGGAALVLTLVLSDRQSRAQPEAGSTPAAEPGAEG